MDGTGQAALEYLIVIGIALFVLTGLLGYSYYYTVGYNSAKNGQGLTLAANSMQTAVNYLSAEQAGSSYVFSFNSPGLNIQNSYFCGNYMVLGSGSSQAAEALSTPIFGEMPLTAGQYSAMGVLTTQNGNPAVALRFDLPVGFINSSDFMSGSTLKYNISFQTFSGSLTPVSNFTLYVYTLSNDLLASQNLSTASGTYSGSISLGQAYLNLKIIIYIPALNIASASCFASGEQLGITLTNLQGSNTPSPFQQNLVVNSSGYLPYESNNLTNVQFSYENGTVIPSWLEGGNIANFSGVGSKSYINISDNAALDPTKITEIAWVKPTGEVGADRVISKAAVTAGLNDYDIYIGPYGNGNFIGARFANKTGSQFIQFNSPAVLNNVWTMIAVTYDGVNTVTLYVNGKGVFSNSTAIRGHLNASSSPLQFGCCKGGQNAFFNGSVADVQIYNAALSQNQIQQVYSEGLGGAPISINALVGWWPLAGNSNDASGNGNSGVENNVSFDTVGSASTATSYWLKLNSGILAHEDALIYMNFYSKSANIFNTINTGEAPQLSATYGQYDDGANVFNFYDNFAGTSLNLNKWTSYGNGTLTVNNGLELLANQGDTNKGISFASAVSTNNIMVEALMNVFGSSGTDIRDRVNHGIAGLTQTSGNGCCDDYGYFSVSTGPQPQYFIGSGASGTAVPFSPSATSYNLLDSQILTSGGDWTWQSLSWPSYSVIFQQTGTFTSGSTFSTGFSATTDLGGSGTTSEENLRWVRIRAYPPNGVMPLVSFGQIS